MSSWRTTSAAKAARLRRLIGTAEAVPFPFEVVGGFGGGARRSFYFMRDFSCSQPFEKPEAWGSHDVLKLMILISMVLQISIFSLLA